MAIFLPPGYWKELFNFNNRKNWLNLDQYIIKIQNKFFPIKTARVLVSAAQCATINSSPIQLIASPGPGKAIKMLSVTIKKIPGPIGNVYANIFYIVSLKVFIDQVGNIPYGFGDFFYQAWFYPLSQLSSQALYIHENDPIVLAGALDDSSGDGSFEIIINYEIISV
jgi:hypothetical protein